MAVPPGRAAAMSQHHRGLLEDRAMLDLIRDTIQKLNELGDRLEAFVDEDQDQRKEERELP